MNDLARSDVHGPVETLRTEWAEWDPAKEEWQPIKRRSLIRFRTDGQVAEDDNHNQEGSNSRTTYTYSQAGQILEIRSETEGGPFTTIYSYDGSGRLVSVTTLAENGNERSSEVFNYDAAGRKTGIRFHPGLRGNRARTALFVSGGGPDPTSTTTTYDDHDQPAEVLVHNAAHLLIQRIIYTRDGAGTLMQEETQFGTVSRFPEIENKLKDAPPEARESLKAALAAAFGPNSSFVTTTYTYDEKGRRVQRIMTMGTLSGDRTTFRFDDHDNPIEENSEHTSRDVGVDEQGNPRHSNERSDKQHTRFVYKYDAEGNWTEREVWTNFEPGGDLKRSSIERRQITYYQPEPR